MEQAKARSNLDQNAANKFLKKSNKGKEAALAVINLIISNMNGYIELDEIITNNFMI